MTTFALTSRADLTSTANTALNTAARFWFFTAVAGQWIFAFYIAVVYASTAARGDWTAWNKHGLAAGNTLGNAALVAHLLLAATITLSGALQLIPAVRARFPLFHRWNGRIYVLSAFVMGITGLSLVWAKRTFAGAGLQYVAVSINAILILICAAMALRTAMVRDFKTHRRWALRLFLAVGGVWFFRVGLMFWLFINKGPVGFNPKTFDGPFITALTFAQYLLPLAVLEIYMHAQERSNAIGRFATAGLLFVLTIVMAIGIFVATMGMWLPRIKTAEVAPHPPASQTLMTPPLHSIALIVTGEAV
ncbi:MAG: hypothetical protein QOK37_446 [Thermoanaerobaculia bacterium]|jgi:hypothetical protein|nr:hypothetical protein [Thermoanaerobaculia bacterium]